jgi:PAS domain S-box-containing protein
MSGLGYQKHAHSGSLALDEQTPELYKAIFAHSNEAIAIIDLEGHYLEQNAAHQQLLGYSDEELLGKTPAIHMGQETFATVVRELKEKGEFLGEITSNTKSGERREIELSAFAMKYAAGAPVCYVGIKRDITDRKRTQQRMALQYAVTRILSEATDLVESVHEILRAVCENLEWQAGALWRVNRENAYLECVDLWHTADVDISEFVATCREMKFEKGVGLPGRIWANAEPAWIPNVAKDSNFPRDTVAMGVGLHAAFGFPIRSGKEVIGAIEFFNREIRQPDEELLRMMASVGGQIGQFQERKRTEAELAQLLLRERSARADAEQANRLKDEFLATVSHELRTPLNAMMGWARMLRSGRLDKESSQHALEVIERNAWAQKQLIEDILDVSRVITGKLNLNLTPVDLASVVEAALDAVRPALEAKAIRIRKEIDPRVRIVSGDPDRLQQVVWNLLSNATKFTPAEGQVELRLYQNARAIQIQVSDTGPGIEPGFLPFVFERFRQADGSTTRKHGGLGLGLAIVRHLVELHGGSIKAENRGDGHGAIFTVSLPLPSGELRIQDVPGALQKPSEISEELPDLKGIHVLVVDDETDALDLITMDLTACGAKVTAFVSASEAFGALESSEFDLLISDIGMPRQDGYELIRKVRAREAASQTKKKIPAVALTAYARVQDRMRALIAGYDTHVAKPIETNELVTVAASLVGRLSKE